MSKGEKVLAALQARRGWGPKELGLVRDLSAKIAKVESLNNPQAYQIGGGPGRGKYQVEIADGGSGTNKVYVQRYKNFLKHHGVDDVLDASDWSVLNSPDPDFALLGADAQDALFYANAAMGNMPLTKYVKGDLNASDLWLDYHWAGPDKDRPARIKHWTHSHGSLNDGRRRRETITNRAPNQKPDEQTLAGVRQETQTRQPPPEEGPPGYGEGGPGEEA